MAKNKKHLGASEERRVGVLIEHFDNKLDLVVEQYADVKKILSEHTKTLDSHTEMIGRLAVDVEIVKSDLTVMKKDQGIMKSDIEFIKHGLKRKVDIDEFSALERRVAALEKRR